MPIAGVLDLEAGLGFGYGHFEVQSSSEFGDERKAYTHGFNMGLKFGAEYRTGRAVSLGTMFQFVFPFYSEGCGHLSSADESCFDRDAMKNSYAMLWGIQASFYFSP